MGSMREAERIQAVQTPIIPVVGEWIRQVPGTISLGQGVVHYSPPVQAIQSMQQALQDFEIHKYKAVEGVEPLRSLIAQKLQVENGIDLSPQYQVVVTAGGNMGFINAVLAITSPGDEIILQSPYYFNHEMAITMAGCKPVLVPTDDQYQLQPDQIRAAITSKTRALVTVSPNNPTGAVYPREVLTAVNEICKARSIYHISDEAYEYFTYEGVEHFSPGSLENSGNYTISLYSLSKAYGFAGWRIGYMVIPQHLMSAVKKIQDTILICPPVLCQYAAVGVLQVGASFCTPYLESLAEVRSLVLDKLTPLQGLIQVPETRGAFYFLIKVQGSYHSMELAHRLIREHKVAVIPGTAFGLEKGCYLRVSYGALEKETVAEGIGRLVQGLKSLL